MGIPSQGWIAIIIWLAVLIFPWTYSLYFIRKINKSGVVRWGAKRSDSTSAKKGESI